MNSINIGKNNFTGGQCQVCKKYHHEINEIWNKKVNHSVNDEPELSICNKCLKRIICAFIDELRY